jgi:Rhodopirellula transposase DDE domain
LDDKSILRLSLDAKARVNIGGFDRGGRNRIPTKTKDHDFDPKTTLTPYGIFLPNLDELFLYFTESMESIKSQIEVYLFVSFSVKILV